MSLIAIPHSLPVSLHTWLEQAFVDAHHRALPTRGWSVCPHPKLADLTHTGALLASKVLGLAPRVVAEQWKNALASHLDVERVDVAGAGHLNITLAASAWARILKEQASLFETIPAQPPTLVEFVSANPTGPLHLGHARQAVLGDVLVRQLKLLGGTVGSEFFYNDAGVQIDMLEASVQLRVLEELGTPLLFERDGATGEQAQAQGARLFPAQGYHGDYVIDLARQWLLKDAQSQSQGLRAFAIEAIQHQQHEDLDYLRVHFDGTVSEQSLFADGSVQAVLNAWTPWTYPSSQWNHHGKVAPEQVGEAWFLKTTLWGDDADRVIVKSDGSTTYFVSDVAYHLNKWTRGWGRAINVQGSDHHGTLARVQAGVQAADPSIGSHYPQVIFHTMIKVVNNGMVVKASKRAGDYLTAREVAHEIGVDAFRMAMLAKKPDTPMTLDLNQWRAQTTNNPVYSLQYAHARLCAVLERLTETSAGDVEYDGWHAAEQALMKELLLWPERQKMAALDLDPVRMSMLAVSLAGHVHEAYQQGPKILALNEDGQQRRVCLYTAAQQALADACEVLGVEAVRRMPAVSDTVQHPPKMR